GFAGTWYASHTVPLNSQPTLVVTISASQPVQQGEFRVVPVAVNVKNAGDSPALVAGSVYWVVADFGSAQPPAVSMTSDTAQHLIDAAFSSSYLAAHVEVRSKQGIVLQIGRPVPAQAFFNKGQEY